MLGPLRTLISVAFLVVFLWAAFTVRLGRLTFAEHVDRIGQTPEATELLDGARSRVAPTLDEVKQRVLGEYVEAPTHLAGEPPRPPPRPRVTPAPKPRELEPAALASRASTPDTDRPGPRRSPASTSRAASDPEPPRSRASTSDAAKLPGRRKPP